MRVTDQMTNRIAEKSGLPIYANRASDASDNTLLSALDNRKRENTSYAEQIKSQRKKSDYQALYQSADSLKEASDAFVTGEDGQNLYEKAAAAGDWSKMTDAFAKLTERYNDTISKLNKSATGINDLYFSEMKNAAAEQKDTFAEIGAYFDKNGKMSVDMDKLKTADITKMRDVIEPFAMKLSYLSERISSQTHAQMDSISNHYDASGSLFSGYESRYDFWG